MTLLNNKNIISNLEKLNSNAAIISAISNISQFSNTIQQMGLQAAEMDQFAHMLQLLSRSYEKSENQKQKMDLEIFEEKISLEDETIKNWYQILIQEAGNYEHLEKYIKN